MIREEGHSLTYVTNGFSVSQWVILVKIELFLFHPSMQGTYVRSPKILFPRTTLFLMTKKKQNKLDYNTVLWIIEPQTLTTVSKVQEDKTILSIAPH